MILFSTFKRSNLPAPSHVDRDPIALIRVIHQQLQPRMVIQNPRIIRLFIMHRVTALNTWEN